MTEHESKKSCWFGSLDAGEIMNCPSECIGYKLSPVINQVGTRVVSRSYGENVTLPPDVALERAVKAPPDQREVYYNDLVDELGEAGPLIEKSCFNMNQNFQEKEDGHN